LYDDSYRKVFFEDVHIVDKFASALWLDGTCFYTNFYRISSQGAFGPSDVDRLRRVVPAVSASIARHFADSGEASSDDVHRTLRDLFSTGDSFRYLTAREAEIAQHILLGYSSEAISANLDISIHSTLTYRKRAYAKLGISSQNELFGLVLKDLIRQDRSGRELS
jgi:DNA-binding CsgD family transcriptional regulator